MGDKIPVRWRAALGLLAGDLRRAIGFVPILILERRLRILGRSAFEEASGALGRGLVCPGGVGVKFN